MTITTTTPAPKPTALQRYDAAIKFAPTGTYIPWQTLADDLRADAEKHTGCQRTMRIDRALDCESKALAQRTVAAFHVELAVRS
jgi:hypothetical protein